MWTTSATPTSGPDDRQRAGRCRPGGRRTGPPSSANMMIAPQLTATPNYMTAPPYMTYPPTTRVEVRDVHRRADRALPQIDLRALATRESDMRPDLVTARRAAVDGENLVLYQTALATHAKRDEHLRTLGNLR